MESFSHTMSRICSSIVANASANFSVDADSCFVDEAFQVWNATSEDFCRCFEDLVFFPAPALLVLASYSAVALKKGAGRR